MYWFVNFMKVVVRQSALIIFDHKNTKQLSVISLSPYFKSTTDLSETLVDLRLIMITAPPVHYNCNIYLPFGFKSTLILNHAII